MSTSDKDELWCQQVLDVVERLTGDEARESIEHAWDEHAAREYVEITLYGPYDVGKSSIIRRLLVESGAPIPEWLTVSARRETFELNAVDVLGVTLTDTPGFAASASHHDELAENALVLTDAFMLVLPPQLLTSGRQLVHDVLSGLHFFGVAQDGVCDATVFVISQSDTLGIDPQDDLDGMRELAGRKINELRGQLSQLCPTPAIVAVAAAPYEEQATTAEQIATHEWDGIDTLAERIAALAERRDELRARAHARYVGRVAREAHSKALETITGLERTLAELSSRRSAAASYRERLDGILQAARADLEDSVIDIVSTVAEGVPESEQSAAEETQRRLGDTLARWADRWEKDFQKVIDDAQLDLERRLERPASTAVEGFLAALSSTEEPNPDPAPNNRVIGVLNGIRADVDDAARAGFLAATGREVEAVLKDLERAKHPKTPRDPGDLGKTAKAAIVLDAGLQIAGSVIAIATVIDAEIRQAKVDRKMREAREQARARVKTFARDFATRVIDGGDGSTGWSGAAEETMAAIKQNLGLHDEADAALDQGDQLTRLREASSEVAALLGLEA